MVILLHLKVNCTVLYTFIVINFKHEPNFQRHRAHWFVGCKLLPPQQTSCLASTLRCQLEKRITSSHTCPHCLPQKAKEKPDLRICSLHLTIKLHPKLSLTSATPIRFQVTSNIDTILKSVNED